MPVNLAAALGCYVIALTGFSWDVAGETRAVPFNPPTELSWIDRVDPATGTWVLGSRRPGLPADTFTPYPGGPLTPFVWPEFTCPEARVRVPRGPAVLP